MIIGFNKPHLSGKELDNITDAISREKLSGNGYYTNQCHKFFEKRYNFKKALLTTSCTDALEMAALLIDIKPGDEVIMPSYTFVSTANPFMLRGAKIVFADSQEKKPNIDAAGIRPLITDKTKAIVVVHYAGVACEMDEIMTLANEFGLFVIEDAAQAVDSFFKGKPLGGIGHLGCFSFHETKNITCGEGGMLVINDERFQSRSEIIWEKGTNRASFYRGEISKYCWIDLGSSFLPSELNAAFLYAQLQNLDDIQNRRKLIWNIYYDALNSAQLPGIYIPEIPDFATNNAHLFYICCESLEQRTELLAHLKKAGVQAIFHYLPLHKSQFFHDKHDGRKLPNADKFSDHIIRLPVYYGLTSEEQEYIIQQIKKFFNK